MKPIMYYSTNLKTKPVTFKDALIKGLAPDKGLFMPEKIPEISRDELVSFPQMPYHEIAYAIANKFLEGEIPAQKLKDLISDAYNYEVPLQNVYDRKYVMRLDQGPTASFKDFAARQMARLMQFYLGEEKRELLILTATSGDTGSAIANAFYGLDNIKIVVLFPLHEVTSRQRKQMTTLGRNVRIMALDAKFDDCQALVKRAFTDSDLDHLKLSSANSINIGRLLPQTMYYFYAYAKLTRSVDEQIIFSVPSGNFGDMMGGLIAMRMGLPVKRFVIATNSNDEFPEFLSSGRYEKIVPSKNCISSAMNVGHPSNLSRVVALYGGVMDETGLVTKMPDLKQMNRDMHAVSISEAETKNAIKEAYAKHKLILEPHGAVAWAALQQYINDSGQNTPDQLMVSLETAHPAKFPEEIREILSIEPNLPQSLEGIEAKEESFMQLENNYEVFKRHLLQNYG
ncbi:MAG: threonine synthase [Deltaproteobacteria bacterium]|nr:threonine synthase [Deltaproteobacteria bacterium]